jgi:transcriptional regulator with XRE-family HTH domain
VGRHSEPTVQIRFGRFLRRHREKRHLTLDAVEALSSNLGERISKSNLSRLENSQASPNLSRLGTLALLYDVPLSEMVERYEIDRRLQHVAARAREHDPAESMEASIDRMRAGSYMEALALARAARERLEPDDGSKTCTDSEYRRLFLAEVQCLLHLGFHESARSDAERVLALEDLSVEHALLAWHGFVASSIRLQRLQVASAALAHAEEILASPEAPPRFRADFALLRGNLLSEQEDHAEAMKSFNLALKRFEELPRPYEVCRCRILVGGALAELGKLRTARAQLDRGLAEAESAGYGRLKCLALSNLTKVDFLRRRYREAENHALRSNQIARDVDFEPVLFRNSWYLRQIALDRSDPRAVKSFERALVMHVGKMPPSMPEARAFRAELTARRGEDPS